MCTGTIYIYGKSDRAVQISSSNEVVLAADDQGATAFEVVACLASGTVSAAELPDCVSFMDASRPGWYIRHMASFLIVDPKNSTDNLAVFNADSSFIVHQNESSMPVTYAVESVNYHWYYISSLADGRLRLDRLADLQDMTFTVSGSTTLSMYTRF